MPGLAIAVLASGTSASDAGTVPPGFAGDLVADGLDHPTATAFAPDGRIFVAEKGGAFRTLQTVRFCEAFVGDYLFAGFRGGRGKRREAQMGDAASDYFATGRNRPVDLKVNSNGSLFVRDLGSGSAYRITR